jgi:hypothetical protein
MRLKHYQEKVIKALNYYLSELDIARNEFEEMLQKLLEILTKLIAEAKCIIYEHIVENLLNNSLLKMARAFVFEKLCQNTIIQNGKFR